MAYERQTLLPGEILALASLDLVRTHGGVDRPWQILNTCQKQNKVYA